MPRLLNGFVPPWNRIGDATRRALPDWGYSFLSAYEGRGDDADIAGLTQIDARLDPIRWKYDRVFRGEDKMLGTLIEYFGRPPPAQACQTRRICHASPANQ